MFRHVKASLHSFGLPGYYTLRNSVNSIFFIYLIGVLSHTQESFTCTTATTIMVGGNRAVPGGNPRPSECCSKIFWRTAPVNSD